MTNLTDEKIADLLGRITPGPWLEDGSVIYTRQTGRGGEENRWQAQVSCLFTTPFAEIGANAEAIALVPDLLAEVARLRSQATELCALLADAYGAYLDFDEILKGRADHEVTVRLEAAEAEVERLRDEIAYRDMRDD